ncbi:uncharacterized protein LOC134222583 [Armigeres subalbatus]|uniref:uncharacterized protein LOC134222583 n=1 Tax=Armigeres subalbatus TaxID=124917 RepID=UPI002ED1EFC0
MSYQKLFDAFKRCYNAEWTKQKIQEEANSTWKSLKQDKENLASNLEVKVAELDKLSIGKKAKFLNFFVKAANRQEAKRPTGGETIKNVDPNIPGELEPLASTSAKQQLQPQELSPVQDPLKLWRRLLDLAKLLLYHRTTKPVFLLV